MSIEETKRVVEGFVDSQDGCWLAEAVQLSSPMGVVARGRDAVQRALAPLYGPSRTPATSTETRFVVADGIAAVEVVVADLLDPTGPGAAGTESLSGPIPAACFYDVVHGEIVRASVYLTPPEADAEKIGSET